MGDSVKYGDNFSIQNCGNNGASFLALIKGPVDPAIGQKVELAAPGNTSPTNYIWQFLPASGSNKKIGEPVYNADSIVIRIVKEDSTPRFLCNSVSDLQKVTAVAHPGDSDMDIWQIIGSAGISPPNPKDDTVPVTAAGRFAQDIQYGDTYITLNLNRKDFQRRLCVPQVAAGAASPDNVVGSESASAPPHVTIFWKIVQPVPGQTGVILPPGDDFEMTKL